MRYRNTNSIMMRSNPGSHGPKPNLPASALNQKSTKATFSRCGVQPITIIKECVTTGTRNGHTGNFLELPGRKNRSTRASKMTQTKT
jgi:hypothetical protein